MMLSQKLKLNYSGTSLYVYEVKLPIEKKIQQE